jgi:Zinc dependent phospholipase C
MPCATIHLLIADRLFDDWRTRGTAAPIDVARGELREAFLHGSLAPDMGFLPGVDRFVSDLAHYVRPMELARALLTQARDDVEEAFAWGWAAHVLADARIHPIVGRAVGERLYGDRARRVDAAEDTATHVAVEVGLDAAFLLGSPHVSRPPGRNHFGPGSVRHLTGALTATYRVAWDSDSLVRGHRRAVTMTRWWPLALRSLASGRPSLRAASHGDDRGAPIGLPVAAPLVWAGRKVTRPGSAARGFFTAPSPPPWMVGEVEAAIEEFPEGFREVVPDRLASAPDRNLETGGPAGAGLGHPASDAAERALCARREGRRGT